MLRPVMMRGVLLALSAMFALGRPPALAADFDLMGLDRTLPDPLSFNNQGFLNGADNLTNSGGADAALTEGGGGAGTVYSGMIGDGATNSTAIRHTGGEVTFTGINAYSGGTSLLGGRLIAANSFALGLGDVFVLGDAALGLQDTVVLFNHVDLGADVTVDVATGSAEIFGDILDAPPAAFGLTKTGAGRLVLTGNNDYGGATHIAAGELVGDSPFALAGFSDFVIDSGARLIVGDNLFFFPAVGSLSGAGNVVIGTNSVLTIGLTGKDTTFSGVITGPGSLEKTGTGTQTLTGRGSSIGGVLSLCDCGGVGGLDISGGAFAADLGVTVANSTLSITDGGVLRQTNPFGAFALDSGRVSVDGNGSQFIVTGLTTIGGFSGDASLVVGNGGTVTSRGGAFVAAAGGDRALALVTGAGSIWTVVGDLVVGCGCDPAVVTVADGGVVVTTGGTLVAPLATLAIGAGGRSGTIRTASVDNAGRIVADFTDSVTFGARISGDGALIKSGPGRLVLTGISTFTGATTVDGGVLAVNGSIAGSGVTVDGGGTLAGTGIVGRTRVDAGGTLAPGNSIGTLTVRDGLTFAAGSVYAVEAGGGNDLVEVVAGAGGAGNADLSGGAVAVEYARSGTVRTRASILDAAGGLGGTRFAGVTDNLAAVASSLGYDGGSVYLVSSLAASLQPGLTVNQRNVGAAIDGYFAGRSSFDLAFALDPAGLTVASGEAGAGAVRSGFEASDRFLDVISDRFVLADGGSAGAQPSAYTAESASGSGAAHAYGALLEKRSAHAMGTLVDGAWKSWGAVYGGTADIDGDGTVVGSHDLDADVYGLAAGAGWREGDLGFGVALGGGRSSFGLADGLGSGDAGIFNAGAYGRADFGRAYLLGALAYGYHDVETSRTAFGDVLTADYGAHSFSGRAEAGYRFDTAFAGVTPYAAFQGTGFFIPSYGEASAGAGTFALRHDGDTATSARGELGLRLDRAIVLDGAVLNLTGRAAWALSSHDGGIVAGFQALPGTGFTVYGAGPAENSALLDLGAAMFRQDGWSASLAFQGRFADGYSSLSGSLKLGFAW